jgi:elongation factor G
VVPLLEVYIEARSPADASGLHRALAELAASAAEISYTMYRETGQAIIRATSEARLNAFCDSLTGTYGLDASFGAVHVAYRETLGRRVEIKYTHRRQSGGSGQYAEVTIVFEPGEPNSGIIFENKTAGGVVPQEYLPAIERGVRVQAETGVLAGFPTVDFKFTLMGGKYHDVDSTPLAFEIAAKACFRAVKDTASPKLLEPVMKVEVHTLCALSDSIVKDLCSRRGRILERESRDGIDVIVAIVPLATLFGYSDALARLSQRQARFTMEYACHEKVALPGPPDDDLFPPAIGMRA